MPNPLLQSINSAVKANHQIAASFTRIGNRQHPGGFLMVAYRNANQAMTQALAGKDIQAKSLRHKETILLHVGSDNRLQATSDVMDGLRNDLAGQLRSEFTDMANIGVQEAATQLGHYGIDAHARITTKLITQVNGSTDAVLARIAAQAAAINALVLTDAEHEQIVGSPERVGAL